MEILRQILIWVFGILGIGFLIMVFVSLFLHGSTIYWVSEKANAQSHLFLFLALLSFVFWAIAMSPDIIILAIFFLFPLVIFISAFSYGISKAQRKFIEWIAPKVNVDPKNPFNKDLFKKK